MPAHPQHIEGRCDNCELQEGTDYHVENWKESDVEVLFEKAKEKYASDARWLFRGSSDNSHWLHSTFDRSIHSARWKPDGGRKARDLEELIYRSFVRGAHLRVETPPAEEEVVEWLALMRHHGAPTRLLDWSYSFWISLFFAAADARDGTASVWALDSWWLDTRARHAAIAGGLKDALEARDADLHCRKATTFLDLYQSQDARFVLKQNCWRLNARLAVQQGVFLCPSDIATCFQSNLVSMIRADSGRQGEALPLHRIDFSAAKAGPKIVERLYRYGISFASLYPDLEGFARSLNALPKIPQLWASDLQMHGVGGAPPSRRP